MAQAIKDIIELNKKIKVGQENGTIAYNNYSETAKPLIEEFKNNYGSTPNTFLKKYLNDIFKKLPATYKIGNYQHYGNNNLHEYVWACIYLKYPNIESLYASSSPQLYVLVHSDGLKFGLDYGAQVENNSKLVSDVKKRTDIQDLIIKANKTINAYKLSQGADYLAGEIDLIKFNERIDVINHWDNSVHIIQQYNTGSIPNKIDNEIVKILEILIPLFEKICEIGLDIAKSEGPVSNLFPQKIFDINQFYLSVKDSCLSYQNVLLTRFVASLLTKPFVILTGLSGSGKTKLAQAFVQWLCQDDTQYEVVPVGADWTNREPLLGYPNALEPEKYVKPDSGVLDLILRAIKQPNLPFFLILDEMNLSHVERYFADFLSVMESKEEIPLYDENTEIEGIRPKLKVPNNLFIIGTVNIDETTNMFSPKVLDRANTIEFRVTAGDMTTFLRDIKEVNMSALETKGAGMAKSFLALAANKSFESKDIDNINTTLLRFFGELKKTGAEFGYRSATEILRLMHQLNVLDDSLLTKEKIDIAIMQKLLPKLHGSRRKLCPVLETLGSFCVEGEVKIIEDVFSKEDFNFNSERVQYPLSLEKITRMHKGAIDNGFASFAEA